MQAQDVIQWVLESPELTDGGERRPKRLAVVGLSDNPERPSYHVSEEMQKRGYQIVPVNPKGGEILGEKVYASLREIPFPVEVVQVFRAPQYVMGVVEDIRQMQHKPRVLWLQEGVINDEAVAAAEADGLWTIQDRCLYKEALKVVGKEHP